MQHHRSSSLSLGAVLAGITAPVSMVFLPFAGFTERIAYVPSPIFRDYGVTGIGTYGEDLNLFEYPAAVGTVQILVLVLAAVLVFPVLTAWRGYRSGSAPGASWAAAARVCGTVAAGFALLVVVTMLAVFPSVEEELIWNTEASSGWVDDWWPGYGGFVTLAALIAATVMLTMLSRRPSATPPAPPPPSPAHPPPPPPPP